MQIQVISVSKPEWKEKGKSKWQAVSVTYSSGGKTAVKSFVSYSPIFNKIKEMDEGAMYDVTSEKDDNGYWQWTAIEKTVSEVGAVEPKVSKANGGNWETAEERAKKQLYIIRQSSLTNAINYYNGEAVDTDTIITTAEKFVQYVLKGVEQDAMEQILSMSNDIPE